MNPNSVTLLGKLVAAPQLSRTTTQTPVAEAVVLVNRQVKDKGDQYTDAEPSRYRHIARRALGEHLAELPGGATVLVVGSVVTET